ncbi:MAG: N-acetylmuramoyl-L-alanine amidase [Bacteroidales bacterium]|nr:N-acetylmuramoyl-L-alanine amidase [Bacteroidales bacterium]
MPSRVNKDLKRPLALLAALLCLCFTTALPAQEAGGLKLSTVVIDPGHGGHDPGAISKNSKLSEKQINLDISKRLGSLIEKEYPDVKVIYTRKTDKFVELSERGNIANRNHADLFISIHVNSAKSTSASGTETFVMGTDKSASNMEVCKRENSVILLEDDYSTKYEGFDPDNPESYIIFNLMQNAHFEQSIAFAEKVQGQFTSRGPIKKSRGIKQAPLMVLWRTTMPSVLVEVGFISNSSDRTVLNGADNRQKIADDIFKAFAAFKKEYDSGGSSTAAAPAAPAAPSMPAAVDTTAKPAKQEEVKGPHFEIQILASSKKLKEGSSELKGAEGVHCRFINGMYKYSVGNFSTDEEARKKLPDVRKKFPGAFVVSVN